jgi:hypothetical protein
MLKQVYLPYKVLDESRVCVDHFLCWLLFSCSDIFNWKKQQAKTRWISPLFKWFLEFKLAIPAYVALAMMCDGPLLVTRKTEESGNLYTAYLNQINWCQLEKGKIIISNLIEWKDSKLQWKQDIWT